MQGVPFLSGGNDFKGMDCWGWVETWFFHVHGVEITDRNGQRSAPEGFQEGFDARSDWILGKAQDGAVWTARALTNGGQIIRNGHCGIVWKDRAYHMHSNGGFCSSPLTDRKLRIEGFWIHKCLQ